MLSRASDIDDCGSPRIKPNSPRLWPGVGAIVNLGWHEKVTTEGVAEELETGLLVSRGSPRDEPGLDERNGTTSARRHSPNRFSSHGCVASSARLRAHRGIGSRDRLGCGENSDRIRLQMFNDQLIAPDEHREWFRGLTSTGPTAAPRTFKFLSSGRRGRRRRSIQGNRPQIRNLLVGILPRTRGSSEGIGP